MRPASILIITASSGLVCAAVVVAGTGWTQASQQSNKTCQDTRESDTSSLMQSRHEITKSSKPWRNLSAGIARTRIMGSSACLSPQCRQWREYDTQSLLQSSKIQLGKSVKPGLPEAGAGDVAASVPAVSWWSCLGLWRNHTVDKLRYAIAWVQLVVTERLEQKTGSGIVVIFMMFIVLLVVCSLGYFVAALISRPNEAFLDSYVRRERPMAADNLASPRPRAVQEGPPGTKSPLSVTFRQEREDSPLLMDFRQNQPQSHQQHDPLRQLEQFRQVTTNSLAQPSPSIEEGVSEDRLPPLCPTLVLPVYEALFAVAMPQLIDPVTHDFHIIGRAGNALLHATIHRFSSGRSLELSLAHAGALPCASLRPASSRSALPKGAFEIHGKDDMLYGALQAKNGYQYYVTIDNDSVMEIEGDVVSLRFTVTAADGMLLGSASINKENYGRDEHLEFRVQPGTDAVLVLLCILGIVLVIPPGMG